MGETQPGSHESLPQPEQESQAAITPAIAHAALTSVDRVFADPDVRTVSDEQKVAWLDKTPTDLKAAINAASVVSWESRHAADKDDHRSFAERNKEWNEEFWNAVQESVNDPNVALPVRGERAMAYRAVGLELNNTDQENGLYTQAEAFRKRYVDADKSDIHQFISDLSSGLKKPDGTIDLDRLEQRLEAIKPMLSVFGTEKNAGELVADFAMAQAMLSQKDAAKESLADRMLQQIQRPPSSDEQVRLEALWQKMNKPREQEATAAHELPPPEPLNPVYVEAAARGKLGRELTEREKEIVQRGGNSSDVIAEARRDVSRRINQVVPIPFEAMNNDTVTEEMLHKAISYAHSPWELELMLRLEIKDETQRKELVKVLRQQADLARQKGEEPAYALAFVRDENGALRIINPTVVDMRDINGRTAEASASAGAENVSTREPAVPTTETQSEQSSSTEAARSRLRFNEKYKDSTGTTYEVVSIGDDLPIALRGPEGQLVIGDEAKDILQRATLVEEQAESPTVTTASEDAPRKDAAEAIREIGDAIAGGMTQVGEAMEKQERRIDHAAQAVGRTLSTREMNIISHGASTEELRAILDYKLDSDSAEAYMRAQQTGKHTLYLRSVDDVTRSLSNVDARYNIGLNKQAFSVHMIPLSAAFAKAVELGIKPVYVLEFRKRDNNTIEPAVNIAVQSLPKNPDGSELSPAESDALIKQVIDARDEAEAKLAGGKTGEETSQQSESAEPVSKDEEKPFPHGEVPDDELERIKYFNEHLLPLRALEVDEFRDTFKGEVKERFKEYVDKQLRAEIADHLAKQHGRIEPTVRGVLSMSKARLADLIVAAQDNVRVDENFSDRVAIMPFKEFAARYLDYHDIPEDFDKVYYTG